MSNLEEYKMFQWLYESVFIGGSKYMPSMLPSVCQLAQSMQWLKYGLDDQRITPWFLGGGADYFHSHSVQTKSRTQLVYNTFETFAIFLLVMHPKHNANYLPLCKIWGFQQCRWRFESCGMLHSVIGVLIPGVLKVHLQGQEDEDEDIWKYQVL